MRVLGIDPGIGCTGYGVLELRNNTFHLIELGVIRTSPKDTMPVRLKTIFEGVSESDFKKSYQAVCSDLNRDNFVGKLIFLVTTVIQKSGILKAGLIRMVVKEQEKPNTKRPMSSVLWDTFTGSASYRGILKRVMNPLVLLSLISNIIIGIFKPIKQ